LLSTFKAPSRRGQFDAARMLWIWCVFVLVFFSVSSAKLVTYILPAIPALALLCACDKAGDAKGSLLWGALLSLASGLGVLAYACGAWSSVQARELLPLIRPALWWTSAWLVTGALTCAACTLRSRSDRLAVAALSVAWFAASATILIAAGAAQSLFSARDVALALRRQGAAGDPGIPLFAVQSYDQSLPFYLQRPVTLVDYRDELDFGLTSDPQRGIATLSQFAQVWLPLSRGFAVMPPATRDRLSAAGVPMREIASFPERVIVSRR
jgi:4-amino-4-deoxy-L-arabinose transferase-like glycosyltransferase